MSEFVNFFGGTEFHIV